MKKIFLYACFLASMSCAVSCISDDNNYDYIDVNEIEKNEFKNIASSYNVPVGQELTISPTFEYTIDKENPDVSFEWTMDGKKIEGANKQSHTFSFEESGTHKVSFYVIDNKTGLKFGASTTIKVMSAFQRGWAILGKADDGRAILNFVIPSSISYTTTVNGKETTRDSIVYKAVKLDVNKSLCKNPTGMCLYVGEADYYDSFGIEEYDEIVVKGDRWEELNGNTLEHETFTTEEFGDEMPEGFKPAECAFTYSMKAVRSEDGYIYCNVKPDGSDFHIGTYTSVPINDGMKFKRLFQNYKYGGPYCNTILALSEDNSLMGIADAGYTNSNSEDASISELSRYQSGNVYLVECDDDDDVSFEQMDDEIIDLLPATGSPDNDYDYSYVEPWFVALTKDPNRNQYSLMSFKVEGYYRNIQYVNAEEYQKRPFGVINNYKGMAVFPNKHYVVIADGNKLYYCQYGTDPKTYEELLGTRILLKTFDHDIVSLGANDVQLGRRSKYEYPGQLGVALDNGEFYIFSLVEQGDEDGICEAVKMEQNFPNEYVQDNHFGKIVDILYKGGRATGYFMYEF